MKEMKLISMTEFVLETNHKIMNTRYNDGELCASHAVSFVKYAKFLKQPLTLEIFVPCDEDGKPYDELEQWEDLLNKHMDHLDDEVPFGWGIEDIAHGFPKKAEQYCQAKERVLLEGFVMDELGRENKVSHHRKSINYTKGTVEDLIKRYGNVIGLTSTAIKQIRL